MSKKRDTFIFKKSWADALRKRSASVQLEVYNAIVSYAVDGVIPEMSEIAEVVFDFIRIEIDENNAKYEETCKKRREAGKRGMNSRYGKLEEYEQGQEPVQPIETEADDNKLNKSNKSKQKVTNLTNANKSNKCYQKVTSITDSDSDYVSDNILTDINKETISNEIVKKEDELLSFPVLVEEVESLDLIDESIIVRPTAEKRVDYARVVNLYHQICVEEVRARKGEPLAGIQKMTDDRKAKVRSVMKEMDFSYEKLEEVFRAIVDSEFLMGNNSRKWAANFDWIFQNKSNWIKILEGKYQNRDGKSDGKSQLEANVGFMARSGVKQENVIF